MASEAAPVEEVAAPEGFQVFVGNLAFSTKKEDLQELFGKAGEISNVSIITRRGRSLGYAFVTFVKEDEAKAAIAQLNKTEVGGRTINVDFAKPPAPPKPKAPKKSTAAEPQETPASAEGGEAAAPATGEGEAKSAKAKKPRRRPKARKPRTDGDTEEAGDAPATNNNASTSASTEEQDSSSAAKEGAPATKTARAPRAKRTKPTGPPSPTLLFVANLAFSVTDDSLKEIFSEYRVKTAKVITKNFGRGAGRSKGFGFVDFETTEDQQAALQNLNGKEVDGRELQLKVGLEHEEKEQTEANGVAATPTEEN